MAHDSKRLRESTRHWAPDTSSAYERPTRRVHTAVCGAFFYPGESGTRNRAAVYSNSYTPWKWRLGKKRTSTARRVSALESGARRGPWLSRARMPRAWPQPSVGPLVPFSRSHAARAPPPLCGGPSRQSVRRTDSPAVGPGGAPQTVRTGARLLAPPLSAFGSLLRRRGRVWEAAATAVLVARRRCAARP